MAITPYLYYDDVGGALKFLARAFGFRERARMVGDDGLLRPDGKINHATMQLGADLVMMGCPGSGYRNPKSVGHATQSLYIDVKGVDRHFERARKAGAVILEEPKDTEYGHRRYGAEDPEGHRWYFAEEIRRHRPKQGARS